MSFLKTQLKLDPLYSIFEKNLYDFREKSEKQTSQSQEELIQKIVGEYMNFLSTNKVAIPKKWEKAIVQELTDQVRAMLIKKTYGCLSVEEFILKQGQQNLKKFNSKKKKFFRFF